MRQNCPKAGQLLSHSDTSVTAFNHSAKLRGLIIERRGAEMKASLILITFRHLRIDRRAHFCRDCGNDDHGYCEERDRCLIYAVIHTNIISIYGAKVCPTLS